MPRNFMFTREEIIEAALELTREKGMAALTARALGERLGSSSKPVFGLFSGMEEVQREVIEAAGRRFRAHQREAITSKRYPPYKASGMAYIAFAREERELFKLLFMRDRTGEPDGGDNREELRPLLDIIRRGTGLSEDDAYSLHMEMWIYVHGIATMIATSYIDWDMEYASRVLTDAYVGLRYRYCGEEKTDGSDQNDGADKKI